MVTMSNHIKAYRINNDKHVPLKQLFGNRINEISASTDLNISLTRGRLALSMYNVRGSLKSIDEKKIRANQARVLFVR